MPEFDDELDREFGARFGALHGSVAAAIPMPAAEEIAARGRRRRRTGHASIAGLAALAVVTAGFLAVGPLHPTFTGTDRNQGSGAAARSEPPAYAPPAGARRAPAGLTIPPGFVPSEGVADVREGLAAVPAPPCAGPSALVRARDNLVAGRTWQLTNAPATYTLLLYQTGTFGGVAYREFSAEAIRCAQVTENGLTWRSQIDPLTFGAEGFRVTTTYTRSTRGALPPDRVEVVLRWGGAVLIVEGPVSALPERNAGLLERRLCVFAHDCAARDGRPAAIVDLTAGEEVWAAVLAVDPDPAATKLGRAVSAASEMGYRTSTASVDCDEGARDGLGLPVEGPETYVAVYFADDAAAERFAAQTTTVAVITVHTYCIG